MSFSTEVITAPEQITAERLTAILRREGVLGADRVTAVSVAGNPAFNSSISHLRLAYDPDPAPEAPSALVLKRNLPEQWARDAGRDEVTFYAEAQAHRNALSMLVPCYDAVHDPDTGDSHLLLLDLSDSHEPLVTRDDLIALRGVPDEARLEAAVDAIARFHAFWWEHPSLAGGSREISGWYGTRERFDHTIARRRREWERFQALPDAAIPAHLRDLYQHTLERLPVLWDRGFGDRITLGANQTLAHGDCYLSQFLWPRDGRGPTYLVDWQSPLADLPAMDLTHLFATFWTPEQRREGDRERRLLRRYLEELKSAGVTGYSWQQLEYDYRLLLIFMVLYPVWDATNGSRRSYWWPKMSCLTRAYADWRCEELLA